MEPISAEKLEEVQKDIDALCEKHGIEMKVQQKTEIVVVPKQAAPEVSS